ncbi:MAG: hypothetical protein OHK0022_48930 [Roseiflexaceae bacterium]
MAKPLKLLEWAASLVIWGFGITIGVTLLAGAGGQFWMWWVARGFQPVQARVAAAWVERSERNDSGRITRINIPHVEFTYSLNGQQYTGDNEFHQITMIKDQAEAEVAKYPPGSTITVYYDQSAPERAVLYREIPIFWTVVRSLLGLTCLGLMLSGVVTTLVAALGVRLRRARA